MSFCCKILLSFLHFWHTCCKICCWETRTGHGIGVSTGDKYSLQIKLDTGQRRFVQPRFLPSFSLYTCTVWGKKLGRSLRTSLGQQTETDTCRGLTSAVSSPCIHHYYIQTDWKHYMEKLALSDHIQLWNNDILILPSANPFAECN